MFFKMISSMFKTPLKAFFTLLIAIHIIGIALAIVSYYLNLPNIIEELLKGNLFKYFISFIVYIMFIAFLYMIVQMHFTAKGYQVKNK